MILHAVVLLLITLALATNGGAVINGKIAERRDFKYQVLLKLQNDEFSGVCSGAIIDEIHIVTAWHCVWDMEPNHIEVVVGSLEQTNDPNASSYGVSDKRLHESRSCNPGELRCYDIAILTTSTEIQFDENVQPVDLPYHDIEDGEECIFAGWGGTEDDNIPSAELRYGIGRVYTYNICNYMLPRIHNYELCFLPLDDDPSTIHDGDSGSPLVCDGELVGVIIRGGGQFFHPVVAINVFDVLDFIYDVEEITCL